MKKTLLTAILLTSIILNAKDFTLKNIGEKEFVFPSVEASSKAKENVANNINIYLHLNYLELLPNSYAKNPFEKINPKGRMPRLFVHDSKMVENSKFIALRLQMEGCGAYCEAFEAQKLFFAHNGKKIEARELFTKEGLAWFNQINHERIQKQIRAFLKTSKDKEQTELYEECLDQDFHGKVHEQSDFWIEKDKFTLYSGRCSNHAMRALDDLGEFANSYTFLELKKHLSPVGRYLLDKNQRKVIDSSTPTGVYRGKIADKYPITLLISTIYDDGSLEAYYWYDKYNKPINLSGKYANSKLEFYVKRHNKAKKRWDAVESFVGTIENHHFKGTWTTLENKKSYGFDMVLN